jgi:hypothetical protein
MEREAEFGVVILKEWMPNLETGRQTQTIAGPIRMVTAKEDLGFQPKGNEANWGVVVGSDESAVLILGCQIRAVYYGNEIDMPERGWWLK